MPTKAPYLTTVPVNIVGSSVFGRYPKISSEKTYNMIISDNWLVPYPGYKKVIEIERKGVGRGIYASNKLKGMVVVIDENVYVIDKNLFTRKIGNLFTFDGDVFIDENNAKEIAICDKKNLYIYNYNLNTFQKVDLDFIPVYVTFHNGYFIAAVFNEPKWRLSGLNNGMNWPANPENVGEFETKSDNVVAVARLPGRGNQIFVIGQNVIEPWTDTGAGLFPYQKSSSYNIDYGCINPNTIASRGNFVVWLGSNENSGVSIMYSTGGDVQQISTDGITFLLESLTNYDKAYGFMTRLEGHLLYHLTFPDDDLSLVYDFNTKMFFNLCDEYTSYHIIKKVAYFDNKYYFVSFSDGNVYELNSKYNDFDGKEIPRIRIPKTARLADGSNFIANQFGFLIEEGYDSEIARVDLSISRDSGVSFGNIVGINKRPCGVRKNKWLEYNLGMANELTFQLRFWGHGRFVVYDGLLEAYQ